MTEFAAEWSIRRFLEVFPSGEGDQRFKACDPAWRSILSQTALLQRAAV
jgi:hypothetical protein